MEHGIFSLFRESRVIAFFSIHSSPISAVHNEQLHFCGTVTLLTPILESCYNLFPFLLLVLLHLMSIVECITFCFVRYHY